MLFVSAIVGYSEEGNLKVRRPNVVVMLSDDQGWGDFGFQGNRNFNTPHLDQLCETGALFNRFYVCPVCAPTRVAAGYKTAAFGKWHNGSQYPYHPNGRGFQEFYGFCSGHWGDYFSPELEKNGTPMTGNGYVTNDFMQHAIEFIQEHRNENFF